MHRLSVYSLCIEGMKTEEKSLRKETRYGIFG